MDKTQDVLSEEAARATELLQGKTVLRVIRHDRSVMIEFGDGARFFVDRVEAGLELSITGT